MGSSTRFSVNLNHKVDFEFICRFSCFRYQHGFMLYSYAHVKTIHFYITCLECQLRKNQLKQIATQINLKLNAIDLSFFFTKNFLVRFMATTTHAYMEVWRSMKPVVAKIKRVAIGGGSDIALACDLTFMEKSAKIGYPPSVIWGCPTSAFWTFRVGMEQVRIPQSF